MAKVQSKTTTKSGSNGPDPLKVSLELLSEADRNAQKAVGHLCAAIRLPVAKPKLIALRFVLQGEHYHARVTADHAQKIREAVDKGGDVLKVVNTLLGNLSKAIAGDLDRFERVLGPRVEGDERAGSTVLPAIQKVVLGCCVYVGGPTPNLTQTQCAQYANSTWQPGNADCLSASKPRSK